MTALPAPRTRTVTRRLAGWIGPAIVIVSLLGALAFLRPGQPSAPFRYVTVSGHSMDPTLHTGDLAVMSRASRYRVGDIVAYRVPAGEPGAGVLVIHRIVGGNARRGFLLKGDNKSDLDPWKPRPGDIVGKLEIHIPKVGLAAALMRTPLAFALLAGLVTFGIAVGRGGSRRRRTV